MAAASKLAHARFIDPTRRYFQAGLIAAHGAALATVDLQALHAVKVTTGRCLAAFLLNLFEESRRERVCVCVVCV